MKQRTVAVLVLALLVLSVAVTACGGNASGPTPTAVPGGDTSSDSGQATATPGGAAKPTTVSASAKVGDAVAVGTYTIAISKATIDADVLTVAFSVDNTKGDKDAVVPAEGFTATDAKGGALTADLVCSTLPVKIPAGKKVDGPVCWGAGGATSTTGFQVHYNPGRTAGKVVTWDLP